MSGIGGQCYRCRRQRADDQLEPAWRRTGARRIPRAQCRDHDEGRQVRQLGLGR